MRARPTIYFTNREFYIFNKAGVYNVKGEPVFGPGWKNTACLVNADYKNAPGYLMVDSRSLFVMTASSPRPGHRRWVKQREGGKQFVLNHPSGDELVKVLVRSFIPSASLCLHSLVSLRLSPRKPSAKFRSLSQCIDATCVASLKSFAMVHASSRVISRQKSIQEKAVETDCYPMTDTKCALNIMKEKGQRCVFTMNLTLYYESHAQGPFTTMLCALS